MVQLIEEGDLSHSGRGHTFIFVLKTDFLKSDDFFGNAVSGFVDNTVGTLSDLLKLFILVFNDANALVIVMLQHVFEVGLGDR